MSDHPDLPRDLDACHALIRAERECYLQELEQLRASLAQSLALVAELKQTVVEQQATIERLQADNALLKRSIFGPRRERYTKPDPQQGVLFDTTQLPEPEPPTANTPEPPPEQEEQQQPEPRQRGQGRRRRIFPDFLPRTTVYHKLNEEDIPEELRNDPTAKRFFKKTSETLECEPARMYVEEQYQEVIVRSDEAGQTTMVTAPKPPQLIDSFAGPGLLACLTTSRFTDHLPYYRLEDILTRYGWRWQSSLPFAFRSHCWEVTSTIGIDGGTNSVHSGELRRTSGSMNPKRPHSYR